MKHLDLFSGIGGFALAARWVGWDTIGFCENEPYCQKILQKHWPDVPIHDDIRTFNGEPFRGTVDVISAGFPCQDISVAGKGAGIDGERSGLWSEAARIIGEVRPRYAVLENVSALLNRGLDRVTGDLAEIGYDCEWHCIPASAVGAPHRRDRIWIVAYPNGSRKMVQGRDRDSQDKKWHITEKVQERQNVKFRTINTSGENVSDSLRSISESGSRRRRIRKSNSTVAHADRFRRNGSPTESRQDGRQVTAGNRYVADNDSGRCQRPRTSGMEQDGKSNWRNDIGWSRSDTDADCKPKIRIAESWRECSQWAVEPDVGRVAHGIPKRVDRLRGLGNAIVPQVAEVIFRAIDETSK